MTTRHARRCCTLLFALATVSITGCASVRGPIIGDGEPYKPLIRRSPASRDALLAAAQRTLSEQLGARVDYRPGSFEVSAVLNEQGETRDRVIVTSIVDGLIEVRYQTEVLDLRGKWMRPDVVCPSYAYAREQVVAGHVIEKAMSMQLTASR